ncbi:MAG: hypothetical protein AMJ65_14635 [Phycisphaerae bacterium SG8_4]|nr:MAG: hypothetical protein AMJ65_14635 [Phycisphaerae bacterium SG8_4]
MKNGAVISLVLALFMVVEISKADFTFDTPTSLGPMINTSTTEGPSCVSSDGLELYFTSDRAGGSGSWDIWVARRETTEGEWGTPVNLGPPVNTGQEEVGGCVSADGLSLYFHSDRAGGHGYTDLYVTTRKAKSDNWAVPVNLGSTVNTAVQEHAPRLSADELELYFSAYNRPGGYGAADIWVARRATVNDPWEPPVNLGPIVNSSADENFPFISADGLLLLFSEDYGGPYRPGGFGDIDIWAATRASVHDPWEVPFNLGPMVNSPSLDTGQLISPDGSMLYFCSERPGGLGGIWGDMYQARVIPVVDLSGDGIVDSADMCIMTDNWGTNNSLCDIGPMPWGDGIVDVNDLVILAEHLFEQYPPAETVEVSEDDNAGQVELERGQILVVTLESNPSTGYSWEQAESNQSTLMQIGEAEFRPSETSEAPMVGAGGWEIFRFRAVSAGQTPLMFLYRRPWEEGAEPLETFLLQVVIH